MTGPVIGSLEDVDSNRHNVTVLRVKEDISCKYPSTTWRLILFAKKWK